MKFAILYALVYPVHGTGILPILPIVQVAEPVPKEFDYSSCPHLYGSSDPCPASINSSCSLSIGCAATSGSCGSVGVGFYVDISTDSIDSCEPLQGNQHFIGLRWVNSTCPFVCEADWVSDQGGYYGTSCIPVNNGFYTPPCGTVPQPCSWPSVAQSQSSVFITPGGGSDSCVPFRMFFHYSPVIPSVNYDPPFTMWVMVAVDSDLPVHANTPLLGYFGHQYLGMYVDDSGALYLSFYHAALGCTPLIMSIGSAEDLRFDFH